MFVREIMQKKVITVTPQETIEKALNIMMKNNINGTPVVESDGKLVGMVVKADIYRFLIEPGHYEICPVDWVMTKSTVTINPNDDVLNAAKLIRDKEVVALPVVENKVVVGIVSIEDLLDYYIKKP